MKAQIINIINKMIELNASQQAINKINSPMSKHRITQDTSLASKETQDNFFISDLTKTIVETFDFKGTQALYSPICDTKTGYDDMDEINDIINNLQKNSDIKGARVNFEQLASKNELNDDDEVMDVVCSESESENCDSKKDKKDVMSDEDDKSECDDFKEKEDTKINEVKEGKVKKRFEFQNKVLDTYLSKAQKLISKISHIGFEHTKLSENKQAEMYISLKNLTAKKKEKPVDNLILMALNKFNVDSPKYKDVSGSPARSFILESEPNILSRKNLYNHKKKGPGNISNGLKKAVKSTNISIEYPNKSFLSQENSIIYNKSKEAKLKKCGSTTTINLASMSNKPISAFSPLSKNAQPLTPKPFSPASDKNLTKKNSIRSSSRGESVKKRVVNARSIVKCKLGEEIKESKTTTNKITWNMPKSSKIDLPYDDKNPEYRMLYLKNIVKEKPLSKNTSATKVGEITTKQRQSRSVNKRSQKLQHAASPSKNNVLNNGPRSYLTRALSTEKYKIMPENLIINRNSRNINTLKKVNSCSTPRSVAPIGPRGNDIRKDRYNACKP